MSEQGTSVRRRTRYASIPNAVVRDTSISPEARLLLCYLMSCSDSWVFYRSQTMKVLGCGRDKYQRIVNELKDARYLIVSAKQGAGGKLEGQCWEVFDEPYPLEQPPAAQDVEEQTADAPQDVVPDASDREPENPAPGHRGPEKPARRLTPQDGKSGPIRKQTKKENQQISCDRAGRDPTQSKIPEQEEVFEACAQYLEAHPRIVDRVATIDEFEKTVRDGAVPADLVKAAKAYAEEQAGNKTQYISGSLSFLKKGRWRDYVAGAAPKEKKPNSPEQVAEFWAEKINRGQQIQYAMSDFVRGALIHFGHFTDEQLREKGYR